MNILLVDDYSLIVDGLEKFFERQPDFTVAAKAYNGKQAQKLLEEMDIQLLITDIKMPVMDGLELIKYAKKNFPDIKIAVLSAYDEFSLAREAFRLGADNYILKTEMEQEKIIAICQEFKEQLEVSEQLSHISSFHMIRDLNRLLGEKDRLEEQLDSSQEVLIHNLFSELVQHGADPGELAARLDALELPPVHPPYFLLLFRAENFDLFEERCRNGSILLFLKGHLERLHNLPPCFPMFETSPGIFSLIAQDCANRRDVCGQIHRAVKDKAEKELHLILSSGVSRPFAALPSARAAFDEAWVACNQRLILGKGQLYFYDDLDVAAGSPSLNTIEKLARFKQLLNNKEFSALQQQIASFSVSPEEASLTNLNDIYQLFQQYLWAMILFIEQNGLSINIRNVFLTYQFFEASISIRELEQWLEDTIRLIADNCEKDDRYMLLIKRYVQENYANHDLSLSMLADALGLSVSYLGKLIKKKMHCHFSDYLNQYRIEQAKKLITGSTKKVYEIAELTGYNNVEHFTRVFKKIVGASPSSYV